MSRAIREKHVWERWEERVRVPHVWERWSFIEESSDDENLVEPVDRRQYKMLPRISLDNWDDLDFACRFRLEKRTTLLVLDLIKDALPYDERR